MSRNFTLLVSLWLLSGSALTLFDGPAPGVLTFAFVVLGWIVALAVHEFGHAWVAWRAGDHTVATRGYLTLDPLKYADPLTSIAFPVFVLAVGGIALPGGAVYLRHDLMRSRGWRSLASLAGPGGTLAMLVLLSIALAVGGLSGWSGSLWPAVALLALFQAMALVFNLLPVPGLDGWGVIRPFLPVSVQQTLRPVEAWAIWILVAAVLFVPGVSAVIFGLAFAVARLFGVPGELVGQGFDAFAFWR